MDFARNDHAGKDASSINPLQLFSIIRSAGSALSAQASLHAQLAQVEWEEEKQRLTNLVIFSVVTFASFLGFLFIVSAFAIALSWDTQYRIPVFITLIIAYFGTLVWAALRVKKLAALGAKSFAATRAEIAADISLLKNAL